MVILSNIPLSPVSSTKRFSPLGFVAKSVRKISSGREFDKYFELAKGTKTFVNADADVFDTLSLMEEIIQKTTHQTKAITKYLESISESDEAFFENIFKFLYRHIQYEMDTQGIEQLRQPIRTWFDRKADCDCFSIFISSVLHNYKGGIRHSLRVIKMKGQQAFHHVYVIVPKVNKSTNNLKRNEYWVIDPVLDNFDQEAEFIVEKYDKSLTGTHKSNGLFVATNSEKVPLGNIIPLRNAGTGIKEVIKNETQKPTAVSNQFTPKTPTSTITNQALPKSTPSSGSTRNLNDGINPQGDNSFAPQPNTPPLPPGGSTTSTGLLFGGIALAAVLAIAFFSSFNNQAQS